MSETTFTPGPWRMKLDDGCFRILSICNHPHLAWEVVSPAQNTGIALIILPDEGDTLEERLERESTANLIASAPELYSALQHAVTEIMALRKAVGNTNAPPVWVVMANEASSQSAGCRMTTAIYTFFHTLSTALLLFCVALSSAVFFGCIGLALMHGSWHGGEPAPVKVKQSALRVRFA